MIARHHVGECPRQVIRKRTLLLAVGEHGVLRKAAHVHRPFDDLAAAAQVQAPFVAHDGHQPEIDVGRVRAVYLHLAHGGASGGNAGWKS